MRLREFIEEFERRYPKQWALQSDKVGLLCGDLNRGVEKILIALDISNAVLSEAAENGYDLIIAHHPLTRNDFLKIDATDRIEGKIYYAIQNDIAIYSAHTNLDFAPDGTSAILAEMLGVKAETYIEDKCEERLYKLVIYVPKEHFEGFRKVLLDIGVGHIGDYSHCSFSSSGEGTFFPLAGASPYIGEVGKFEKTAEFRFETIVPHHLLNDAIGIIRNHHPYEEPAFDIYPLANDKVKGGFGIIGLFETTIRLSDVVERCRDKLLTNAVRYIGDGERFVRRAAVLGGSGDAVIDNIISSAVDVFITGEISHHSAIALIDAGLTAVLPGHFATEWILLPRIREVTNEICDLFSAKAIIKISDAEQPMFNIHQQIGK